MMRRVILVLVVLGVIAGVSGGIWWYVRRNRGWRLLARAQLKIQAGGKENLQDAADLADRYIRQAPHLWEGYYWKAMAYSRQGRYAEAREILEKILAEAEAGRMRSDDAEVRVLLSDTYAHPAREWLASSRGEGDANRVISAVQQLRQANGELDKIPPEQAQQKSRVHYAKGLNLLDIAAACERLADISTDANSAVQADEARAGAIAELMRVMSMEPSNATAAEHLVRACIRRDDANSLAAARQAIFSGEDPPPLPAALLTMDLARREAAGLTRQQARERWLGAAGQLDELLRRHPDVTEVKVHRAQLALHQLLDTDTAERLCKEILEADRRNPDGRMLRARLLLQAGRLAEAENELFTLTTDHPAWTEAQLLYAEAATKSGKAELAKDVMRTITRHDPNQPQALAFMVRALLKDVPNEALDSADRLLRACPDDPVAIRLYVEACLHTDQSNRAIEKVKEVVDRHGQRPDLLLAAADCFARLGRLEERAKAIQAAASASTDSLANLLAVAQAMVFSDKAARAEGLLNQRLVGAPAHEQPLIHHGLGRICEQTGRTLEAIEQYRAASRLDPGNPGHQLALARALLEDRQMEECEEVLQVLPRSDPEVDMLRLRLDLALGRPEQSAEIISRLNPAGRSGYPVAMALLQGGQTQRCVELCQAELRDSPEDKDLRWLLGQAYWRLGDSNACIEQLKLALKLAPTQLSLYRDIAAVVARQGGDANRAASELSRIAGARTDMVELACAWLLGRQGRWAEAAERYRGLAERSDLPEGARHQARMYRAAALAAAGQVDQAVAELDRLAQTPTLGKEAEFRKAVLWIDTRRLPEANAALVRMRDAAVTQQDADGLYRVIFLYARMGRPDPAIEACDELLKLRPDDARAILARARLLLAVGRLQEGIAAYQKAIERQSDNYRLYLAMAADMDGVQKPMEALKILDRLASLGHAGPAQEAAYAMRAHLLATWGLPGQAVEWLEKLMASEYANSPRFRLALGQALARLGQTPRATTVLMAVPSYVAEYIPARSTLAQMAKDPNEKLSILAEVDRLRPGLTGILEQRMAILREANRPAEALAVFRDFERARGRDRLPTGASHAAVQLLLEANQPAEARDLARRVSSETGHPLWRRLAAVLLLDEDPNGAEALIPDANQAAFQDAVVGLCAAAGRDDALSVSRWAERITQLDQQGRRAPPAGGIPAPYRLLVAVAAGATEQVGALSAELKDAQGVEAIVAVELASAASTSPRARQEAGALLKIHLAGEVGLPSLGAGWAMDLLRARPTCQWAAVAAMTMAPGTATLTQIRDLVEPKDCVVHKLAVASMLTVQGQHEQAAAAFAEARRAGLGGPGALFQEAVALEHAGKLPEAIALYQRVWDATKSPVAGNNAAYLISQVEPNDPSRLRQARSMIEESLRTAPAAPPFLDTLGWIIYLQGEKELACTYLRRAIKGQPDSPESHLHVGLAEAAVGNELLARWHLEAAISLAELLEKDKRSTPSEDKAKAWAKKELERLGPAGS